MADDEPTILGWASTILRWRRFIAIVAVVGGFAGIAVGRFSARVYNSTATFIPEAQETVSSGLALAASQFGIRVPAAGGGWGPPMYAEVLRSYMLRAPIVMDTFAIAEEGGRRAALTDLLKVREADPALRTEYGVRAMERIVRVTEIIPLGAVRVSVSTKWPSVSLAIANRLVQGVNDFNLKTRKSQATAERQFNEARAKEAEDTLRAAEQNLLTFLRANRSLVPPDVSVEHDRLQRRVGLLTQVYTTLLQGVEEARMREVRDTPVITLIETPRLAALGQSRQTLQKGLLGGIGGVVLAMLVAFLSDGMKGLSGRPTEESRQFFALVSEATPAFLKRSVRSAGH